ncbi:MAG: hypothetical protein C0518_15965 [Opitutus sp.]|nr:hypothetical protein [Opitutus sp.]
MRDSSANSRCCISIGSAWDDFMRGNPPRNVPPRDWQLSGALPSTVNHLPFRRTNRPNHRCALDGPLRTIAGPMRTAHRRRMRKLSELEGAALGIIARAQPVTPYQVRKIFAQSPNPHWSASAGSIYPLIKRLEEAHFVSAEEHATGERFGQKYALTKTGRKRLRHWILGGDHVKLVGLPDLVRIRVAMMLVLSADEQRQFLTAMEQKLLEALAITRADVTLKAAEKDRDPLSLLISRGALLQTEARLVWIREVQAVMLGPRRPD